MKEGKCREEDSGERQIFSEFNISKLHYCFKVNIFWGKWLVLRLKAEKNS